MSKVVLLSKDKKIRYGYKKSIEEKGEFFFETKRELDVYDIIKKGNKFYSVAIKNPKTDTVGVDETDFEISPKETEEQEFTCPYCKEVDYDAFEKSDGETYCGNCGSTVTLKIVANGDYNVIPLSPTSVIVIN